MNGSLFNLQRFFYKLRTTKRYWLPLAVLVVIAVNLVGMYLIPKKYVAQAVVRIDKSKFDAMTGAATDLLSTKNLIQQIRLDMGSPRTLGSVANQLNLDRGLAPGSREYQQLIFRMNRALEITGNEDNGTIYISYSGPSGGRATATIEELILQTTRKFNQTYQNQTSYSEILIKQQLAEANANLSSATQSVSSFKKDNGNISTELLTQKQHNLEQLIDELQRNKYEHSMVGERLALLESQANEARQTADTNQTTAVVNDPQLQSLIAQKNQLDQQLQTLLQNFTEKHWQVIPLKTQIATVEKQIEEARANQQTRIEKNPNLALGGLQTTIDQSRVEKQGLDSLIANQESSIAQLKEEIQSLLSRLPNYQAQLTDLQNKQAIASDRVSLLTRRLDEARMAAAFVGAKNPQLNILGPQLITITSPYVPNPSPSPSLKMIAAGSLVCGFGAALALVFLLTLIDQTVRTMAEARGSLQMPVLGVVQRIDDAGASRQGHYRAAAYSASLLVLLLVLAVVGRSMHYEPLKHALHSFWGQ